MTPDGPPRRIEADREDLMREATALRQRAEFRISGESPSVIAGYRNDGSLSVYFGPDPCFHFDADGRLRRAFVGGDLFRTQGDTLARLRRVHTREAVELHRDDLAPDEREELLQQARQQLRAFSDTLRSQAAECLQEIPADAQIVDVLVDDLSRIVAQPIRLAPAIRGKK